ncbi:MAG: CYTH domain-containing protein [Planctomycetota bacterium]
MALEIERKYKVLELDKKHLPRKGYQVIQGYLSYEPVLRVRIVDSRKAIFSIKGKGFLSREEFEYPIPLFHAKGLLKFSLGTIKKTRYKIGRLELDIFHGKLKGLILAEVELKDRREKVRLPDWLKCREVTYDPRYQNSALARFGLPPE